ncbi:hypothetical protein [Candidatus Steffania adelgidicola]|nr:hypothetical protein [Candidatus Steffania adelgidicola]
MSVVRYVTNVNIANFIANFYLPTPSSSDEIVSRNQVTLLGQLHSQ